MSTSLADLLDLSPADRQDLDRESETSPQVPRKAVAVLVYIEHDGPDGPVHGCAESPY